MYQVYEMSRLNMSYTVLSKRKLLKLVMNGYMRGWDDPRMPTIKGLRRRGYTPAILNAYCNEIGVTRNMNIVQYERLASIARAQLHDTTPRVMGVVYPLKVVISGRDFSNAAANTFTVPDFPFDVTRGTHTVTAESYVYIDRSDFRLEDSEDYFGLAPGKVVGLKYAFRIRCDSVETNKSTGEPILLRCTALPDSDAPEDKPKGTIQWVPASTAVKVEVRLYNHLFTVEEPTDEGWESELNPQSEVVIRDALIDSSIFNWKPVPEKHFQFERIGFFVVDKDSVIDATNPKNSKLVLNLTVNLKDSKPKSTTAAGPSRSRKEEQAKQLAEKMVSPLVLITGGMLILCSVLIGSHVCGSPGYVPHPDRPLLSVQRGRCSHS